MYQDLFPLGLVAWTLGWAVVSFLVSAIPFGLVIARAHGVDVRKVGSGNIGTTNVARSVGKSASALTLLLDAGKGALCVCLGRLLLPILSGMEAPALDVTQPCGWAPSLIYLACVLGHVFSPYLHFHGGKGIAVGFGGALGLHWPLALVILGVFVVVVIPTRYVSLSSICAAVALSGGALLMGFSYPALVPVLVVTVVVIDAHRENIERLRRHEEKRFAFHKDEG